MFDLVVGVADLVVVVPDLMVMVGSLSSEEGLLLLVQSKGGEGSRYPGVVLLCRFREGSLELSSLDSPDSLEYLDF